MKDVRKIIRYAILIVIIALVFVPPCYHSIQSVYDVRLYVHNRDELFFWLRDNIGDDVLIITQHLSDMCDMPFFRIFDDIKYETSTYKDRVPSILEQFRSEGGYFYSFYSKNGIEVTCISYLLDYANLTRLIKDRKEVYLVIDENAWQTAGKEHLYLLFKSYVLTVKKQAGEWTLYSLIK